MADGRIEWTINQDKRDWNRTANLMATIYNSTRAKESDMVDADAINPYTAKGGKKRGGIRITPANVHLLKALVPRRGK